MVRETDAVGEGWSNVRGCTSDHVCNAEAEVLRAGPERTLMILRHTRTTGPPLLICLMIDEWGLCLILARPVD